MLADPLPDLGSDRLAARAPGRGSRPRPRAGVSAVRRDDAADGELLHVLELRVQYRLRVMSTATVRRAAVRPGREMSMPVSEGGSGARPIGIFLRFAFALTSDMAGISEQ